MTTRMNAEGLEPADLEMRYWARRGTKTAAFLLVIPGCTTMGVGMGLLATNPLAYGVIGFGAGLLVWGLIVALSK